jgi:hypothetical protein
MHKYLNNEIDAPTFVTNYQNQWKHWRDFRSKELFSLDQGSNGAFSRAFTAADCYEPPEAGHKTDWDIGDNKLRSEIAGIVGEIKDVQ